MYSDSSGLITSFDQCRHVLKVKLCTAEVHEDSMKHNDHSK